MSTGQNPTVLLFGNGEARLEFEDVPVPGENDLLIRTRLSLLNAGTEWAIVDGHLPFLPFPVRPGYCNVGRVVGAGDALDSSWIGRRVITRSRHAAFVSVPATAATWVNREDIEDADAAFFGIADIAMNGVRRAEIDFGESVVIFGAGLIGQLLARVCLIAGARSVVVIDSNTDRLGRLPADARIKTQDSLDRVDRLISDVNHGRLADVVFDATGNKTLLPIEAKMARPQGRFVLVGSPRGGEIAFDFYELCMARSISIIGAHVDSHPQFETSLNPWTPQRHAELFLDMLGDGALSVEGLVTDCVPGLSAAQIYGWPIDRRARSLGVIMDWSEVVTHGAVA